MLLASVFGRPTRIAYTAVIVQTRWLLLLTAKPRLEESSVVTTPVLVPPVTTNPRRNMVIMGFVTPALDILPHSSASITRILVCAVATASNSQAATQLSATHVPVASFLQRASIHAFVKMLLLQTLHARSLLLLICQDHCMALAWSVPR